MSSGYYRLGANLHPLEPGFDAPKSHTTASLNILGTEIESSTLLLESKTIDLPAPQAMGYTGNTCAYCGSTRMQVAGHCEVCCDCGETTGCS